MKQSSLVFVRLAQCSVTIVAAQCVLVFFCFLGQTQAQIQTYNIAPRITDSRIDTALDDHYAFINRIVPQRGRLVVFFPGTGAIPRNYRVFPSVAANLGFHAIGLTYPNDETVNGRCGAASSDLECAGAIRGETLDGVDRTPRATVSRANSIENRLIRLLQYLHRQFPQDNWAQYLERTTTGDTVPRWGNIIVAGHSQGGGYAGYIAVVKRVARSIMFCAMDYNPVARRLASWITGAKATPQGEFFAMGHLRDELVPYGLLSQEAWAAYGIPAAGAVVNADSVRPPFPQTRSFSTDRESLPLGALITIGPRHNVPIVDVNTPQEQGRYVFQPVWEYLLTAPSLTSSVEAEQEYNAIIAPNPASDRIVLTTSTQITKVSFVNTLGQILLEYPIEQYKGQMPVTLDVSSLPIGVYILQCQTASSGILRKTIHIMR